MAARELKTPPAYVVSSVDHALRAAVMLQMEGPLTVSQVADRLGVARSTAHRLLSTLVYRDFAAQDDERRYHPGPVLALARHSQSGTSQLRAAALPHLQQLVDVVGETANLTVRTGATARFAASVECTQALRVGSREGMAFPAHRTTGGLVLLAALDPARGGGALPGRGVCRATRGAPGPRPAREGPGPGQEVGVRRSTMSARSGDRRRRGAGAGRGRRAGRRPVGVDAQRQVRPAPAARARGGAAAGGRCGRGGAGG